MSTYGSIENDLLERTPMFGLRLWVVIGIGVGTSMVLILGLLTCWLIGTTRSRYKQSSSQSTKLVIGPDFCKDIKEVVHYDGPSPILETGGHILSEGDISEAEKEVVTFGYGSTVSPDITVVKCKHQNNANAIKEVVNARFYTPENDGEKRQHCVYQTYYVESEFAGPVSSISNLGWGNWYTLRELEIATNYFADSNILGEGGYGIVYQGILPDGSQIAVKSLLNSRGQAEREFKIEVEAIGWVRHKNLVHLLGCCVEGFHRMLVYEYVDNGNLYQWLHGPPGEETHIPWDIRMKIVYGTAKGLSYLHEDLEPKVVHRDVKSSNILLDSSWNAKVSDFGIAKLLDSRSDCVTTRVMGTFGYVAPEYASTGLLTERSDVYSFGVLMMEIITGREPVNHEMPQGEVKLVDWIKLMVASRRTEEILDPKLKVKPSTRALKRALLVSLKCVDPDAEKRPKMGHVMYMLESNDFL